MSSSSTWAIQISSSINWNICFIFHLQGQLIYSVLLFFWLLFTAAEDHYFVILFSDFTSLQSATYCFSSRFLIMRKLQPCGRQPADKDYSISGGKHNIRSSLTSMYSCSRAASLGFFFFYKKPFSSYRTASELTSRLKEIKSSHESLAAFSLSYIR